jgi:hypothetical protein
MFTISRVLEGLTLKYSKGQRKIDQLYTLFENWVLLRNQKATAWTPKLSQEFEAFALGQPLSFWEEPGIVSGYFPPAYRSDTCDPSHQQPLRG